MKVTVEKKENHQVVMEITVPAEEVQKAYNNECKVICNQINIPGFRKGKAPKHIVERQVGQEAILNEAFDRLCNRTFADALVQEKTDAVSRPEVEVVTLELGKDAVYKATFIAKPDVTLGEYKGLKVEVKADVVDDEAVMAQVNKMADNQADMVDAEEGAAVEDGDFVTLDFKGYVNEKAEENAFAGGEGKDYPLQIGSHNFIPGFEEQLVGAKIGETMDVNVTFPEEYHSEELKGKPAVFECKVNSIKRKVLPAIDDEFAKKASTFQTLDELKADVKANLEKNAASKAANEKREAVLNQACANATVDIPQVMVETRINTMIQELTMRLEQQGLKLDQYMNYAGLDANKLRDQYKEMAAKNVKTDLVLDAIADAENINVDAAEVDAEIANMAKTYGATVNQVKKIVTEQGRLSDLVASIMRRKTANFVISNAVE